MSEGWTLIFIAFLMSPVAASDWQSLHKGDDNSQVWSRSVEQPPFKELKGEVITEGEPTLFISLLLDTPRISSWVTHASSASVLRHRPPNRHMVYTVFSPPWPLRKRDMVSVSEFWRDMETRTVYLLAESRPMAARQEHDHIRIRHSIGCWQIKPLGADKIRIRYQGFTDVGGVLPYWVSNPVAAKSLHQTLISIPKALINTKVKAIEIPIRHQADFSYCDNLYKWE